MRSTFSSLGMAGALLSVAAFGGDRGLSSAFVDLSNKPRLRRSGLPNRGNANAMGSNANARRLAAKKRRVKAHRARR